MFNQQEKPKLVESNKCPKCGASFYCSTSSKCWCYEYDVPTEQMEKIEEEFQDCLCPKCLKAYAT